MSNVIMCSDCKKCDGDRCTYFDNDMDRESTIACILFEPKKPTLFHRLTASSEVLAVELVTLDCDGWWSYVGIGKRKTYPTREEAIAATVAKLKELADAVDED